MAEALELPQVKHRALVRTVSGIHGLARDISVVQGGYRYSGESPPERLQPPALGEHTEEILRELGFSRRDIEELSSEQSDMTERRENDLLEKAHEWWRTAIIDIHPGSIGIRGFPIQELIGKLSFVEMIWLMVRGELPAPSHARLLEAALVASVDHGPHAPSISIARMAVTCGVDLNNAMASGINVLGDVHGGPSQQCMRLYELIANEPLRWPVPRERHGSRTGRVHCGRGARSFRASGIDSTRSIPAWRRCSAWYKRALRAAR